jgi:hypothetical protein
MEFLNHIGWRPKIGDPSMMGWFTVVMYGIGAVLALRVWIRQRDLLWMGVALVMTALCVNKQLDLQSLFTDIGRVAFHYLGLFEQRRQFQKWFVLGVVGIAGVAGVWFLWRRYTFWIRHKLLSSGLFFLVTFIVVRAISFHHFDVFIKSEILGGVRMNWVLELGGISMICLAALREPARSC